MIKPTIHINGTSKQSLLEGYVEALIAVQAAIDAMRKAAPNGRDYYPQGDAAIKTALAEHEARIIALNNVAEELTCLAEYCSD